MAVGLVLLVPACTDDDGGGPDATPTTTAPDRPDPGSGDELWSTDLPVIGPAVAAGDVAVVYAYERRDDAPMLRIVGIDPATGEELWSEPAGAGFVTPGIPLGPTVVDGPDREPLVAFFRPTGTDVRHPRAEAQVVVLDPRTGETVAATGELLSTDHPEPCDDGTDVCTRTATNEGDPRPRYRLDLETGEVRTEPSPTAPTRPIAAGGLIDLRTGGIEAIARVDGAEVLWATPVAEAFDEGWSTDNGWSFDLDVDDGLFVGSVGRPRPDDPDGYEADLAQELAVAVDGDDGSVAWRDEGSSVWCAYNLAVPAALAGDDEHAGVPLRCRMTGTAVVADDDVTFPGLDVTIERFDRVTGETVWSVAAGDTPGLIDEGGVAAVVDERSMLVVTGDGPTVIDLETGETREPDDDLVAACQSEPVTFEGPPWTPEGRDEPITDRTGGTLVEPCGPDLEPVDAPLTLDLAAAAGVPVGDALVVALDGRLVGYPAS